ncbi:hypothetical protein KUV28_12130 [Ferrimonas balearica]|nr:hypothetical protein [Ferrimonas balearica]
MPRALLASTALIALTSPAFAADLGPLVTPAELDGAEVTVLDVRGDAYDQGHIEGALDAPYGLFRGPADNPGQLVPVEELEATYESLGLSPDEPVVIVSQGANDSDFGAAARVYWTLKSSGFTDLSILNGGAQAWVNAGLPVTQDVPEIEPTELDIAWDDTWRARAGPGGNRDMCRRLPRRSAAGRGPARPGGGARRGRSAGHCPPCARG